MDILIVGGGPAGLSAAVWAARAGANVCVVERGTRLGGILNQCIHHGFGTHIYNEELTGPEYAERLLCEARREKITFMLESFVTNLSNDRECVVINPQGRHVLRPKAVILAMGCRERTRGAIGIPGSRPAGVFTAGVAQMLVNLRGLRLGRRVVILGSGDIGLIMARRMTFEGSKVLGVYEINKTPSGLKRNIAQCLQDFDIPLFCGRTVTRIVGNVRLEGVVVQETDGGYEEFIPCDTLLLSVGLIPENELTRALGADINPLTGGASVCSRLMSSIDGVFSCGNVLHVHDIVDYVTYEARAAAEAAEKFLQGERFTNHAAIISGDNVRYVLPERVSHKPGEKFTVSLRVTHALRNAAIVARQDGREILRRKRRMVLPSEMELFDIALDSMGDVVVSVESAEAQAAVEQFC